MAVQKISTFEIDVTYTDAGDDTVKRTKVVVSLLEDGSVGVIVPYEAHGAFTVSLTDLIELGDRLRHVKNNERMKPGRTIFGGS